VKRTQKQNKSCKKLNKAEAKQNQKLVNEKVFLALTECIDPKQILLEIPFKKSANQLKVLKAVLEIWQGEIPQVKKYLYLHMYVYVLEDSLCNSWEGRSLGSGTYGSRSGYNTVKTGVYYFDKTKSEIKVVYCKPYNFMRKEQTR